MEVLLKKIEYFSDKKKLGNTLGFLIFLCFVGNYLSNIVGK